MRKTIVRFRKAIIDIAPMMEEANVNTVLNSIKDTSCMALMPQTKDWDERLEELDDLTSEQGELLTKLFDELEVAHDSLAKASSTLGRLSRSLSGKQLLTVLKASICPLIQINALENFWKDPAVTQQKTELPEDTHWRVKLTMTPDPMTEAMRRESVNSPTCLLVATLAYKMLKKFGGSTTLKEMQERYGVRPKQLALYITEWKYLGGTDRKALAVKQRATDDEPEPSTSK